MRLLSIGNSFSEDAAYYLSQVAAAGNKSLTHVNLIIGGCTLEHHIDAFNNGELYIREENGIFTAFHITTSCLYDAMLYCVERNCDGINLGGVEGDLQDGLYEFKSKFCPLLAEYYGEFALVISESGYKFIKNGLPKMVRAYKKVTRFLKGDKREK